MSAAMDVFAGFPPQVHVGSSPRTGTYTLMPGYYAIHGHQAGAAAPNAAQLFNEGKIAVFKGSPDSATAAGNELSPVYSLTPGGSLAVPTGLIFVRLSEGITVTEREDEIKGAGYEIAESLAYAPNAAWVRARSRKIEDSLKGVEALRKLPDVESVETQMLMESARR